MKIPMWQLDAFTTRRFAGNPAAVCALEAWPDDATLQAIAAENNLSETAFLVARIDGDYALRWFTPVAEIELCGHATLASAEVVLTRVEPGREAVTFHSRSGPLTVRRRADGALEMDFPSLPPERVADPPPELLRALGGAPVETWAARDFLVVYATEREVRALAPDFAALMHVPCMAVIVTAPGEGVDFVSRFFAPKKGVPEDPVTGSAHCTLTPYWSRRLGKTRLQARQVSARGGELECEDRGARVALVGRVIPYLEGTIEA
jgi:predicted PhzF superfamily epimerase YddE/YHI9